MKNSILLALVIGGLATPLFADTTNVLTDERSKVSYAIGLRIGAGWKQNGIDGDFNLVLRGLQDAQTGTPGLLTPQEVNQILSEYQKKMMAKQQVQRSEEAVKNKSEGEAFLAANKSKPGVVTLPDGLQYKILTPGNGPIPNAASIVDVNYRGTFINGMEFDSSARVGHPLKITVAGGVIPGWTEVLQLMPVGSKWQVYIPANLAYGEKGYQRILPNTALIFDIELLSIENPKPAPVAPVTPAPTAPLTSDIIKVPSVDEMNKGAKIEVIKSSDVQKAQQQSQP